MFITNVFKWDRTRSSLSRRKLKVYLELYSLPYIRFYFSNIFLTTKLTSNLNSLNTNLTQHSPHLAKQVFMTVGKSASYPWSLNLQVECETGAFSNKDLVIDVGRRDEGRHHESTEKINRWKRVVDDPKHWSNSGE